MKIGIVGQGFVGTAVHEGLKQHFKIETYDIAKASTCESIEELAIKSDVIFVCLPTPMRESGECYLGILEEIINDLIKAAYNKARENLKKKSAEELSKITGGFNLPIDFKLPF